MIEVSELIEIVTSILWVYPTTIPKIILQNEMSPSS